jgi:L-alanine-DL-glutamate epimerase-like enolase superfamily enzyme
VYQLLGGKYRDQIRVYADTASGLNGIKERIAKGFTWLKIDLGMGRDAASSIQPQGADMSLAHPFAAITLTDKGCQAMADRFGEARAAAGSIPLSADHFGSISVKSCIRLANALSKHQPGWLEDMIPWQYTDLLREIKSSIDVPLLTGEDIYLLENFKPLIDTHAVDYVHPDLATAGGILETKKIGDYAEEHGVAMAMHQAGTPFTMLANIHCAAATHNFLAMEHHGVDVAHWEDLVTGIDKPIVNKGYVKVPDAPGLGIEPNPDVIKAHLERGQEYFGPTDSWNTDRSNDRLWSRAKNVLAEPTA